MFIEAVGSSGSKNAEARLVCMKLGRKVLIDAGSAAFIPDEELALVDIVLLTHSHLDHILDLGFILDSMVSNRTKPLVVMGSEACLSIVQKHYMNGLLWPDFSKIKVNGKPILEYKVLEDEIWIKLPDNIECMSIPVNHPAGARGFLFKAENKIVIYSGDTGPTDKIWRLANEMGNVVSVFIEVSFPNSKKNIAISSDHLCPSLAKDELEKLDNKTVPVYIFHMKPWFEDEIIEELILPGREVKLLMPGYRVQF